MFMIALYSKNIMNYLFGKIISLIYNVLNCRRGCTAINKKNLQHTKPYFLFRSDNYHNDLTYKNKIEDNRCGRKVDHFPTSAIMSTLLGMALSKELPVLLILNGTLVNKNKGINFLNFPLILWNYLDDFFCI